jgi:pimeloyl-ACP methyl ester carboxylesterase
MLEFTDATKRDGSLATLDACSFAAQPGRLSGFLGPSYGTHLALYYAQARPDHVAHAVLRCVSPPVRFVRDPAVAKS